MTLDPRALAPATLLLLLATPGTAQAPVHLTFDWPAGRSAVVTTTTTSATVEGDITTVRTTLEVKEYAWR